MSCADARLRELITGAHPVFARLPGAWCIVEQDPYLTLLWANEEFYETMGCSQEEMGFRYAHRLSALWDADGVDELVRFAREGADGGVVCLRHRLSSAKDARVFETQATCLSDEGLLCCLLRDCTHETDIEARNQRFHELGVLTTGYAGIEVFSYDCTSHAARVMFAGGVLDKLPGTHGVYEDFPETLIGAGFVHPQDVSQVRKAFEPSAERETRTSCEVRMGGPALGTERWRWYRLTLVGCSDALSSSGFAGTGLIRDITDHKELTMAYLNDTQFYYALLSEKDAYAHVDVTDDVVLKIGGIWNLYNEVVDTMSYTEVVTTFARRVVHPDDLAHYLDIMSCENFASSLANGINHVGCEFRRIVEQNKMAWMELGIHLLKDPITQHVLALISVKNIDKRKRQELQCSVGEGDADEVALAYSCERLKRIVSDGEGQESRNGELELAARAHPATSAIGKATLFSDFLSVYGEIAYLVDPDTFTLICGNGAFYERIGETPENCRGMKCYEAMQGRTTPCPFCSKANWSTDKFFMWRNDNKVLDQEFLIKNKLVSWEGREALLAIAVDVSNDKSIVDSLDDGVSEIRCLVGGIQQMNAARDLGEVIDRALEASGDFFRAEGVRFWARERSDAPYKCEVAWSRGGGAFVPLVPDDRSLETWLEAQCWDEPVMVESPESVLGSSYAMYCYMKDNGVANQRWAKVTYGAEEKADAYYLSVENLGANFQNVAFLESLSVFIASEISRRRMMEELLYASGHDDLTGLLNRGSYENMLATFDSDSARCVGVVSANVNSMRHINGSKGFAAGNYYLQQFATMLLDVFRPEDVYRLNGDEFAVIAPDLDREELETRMRDVRGMVRSNGLFTVALGYSWDEVEKDLDVLTNQAVHAMEADKKRYHDVALDHADNDRRTALRNLVAALGSGKFLVYLQPKVRLSDGVMVGAEALIRYRDDQLGIVAPARFIQGLEDSGLIRHVDLFVFEWACQVMERWEREGVAVPVSLNFSRRTLLESDLLASMENIVSQYVLDRRNLEVEITESFAAIGKSVLYQAANDLLEVGFTLSLDDFGTKYTDLSILSNIDFSVIKLDKSLIEAIVDDPTKQTVLKHIISMCDELRVNVIAEGVETVEQESILRRLGCQNGQGYLYSRPIPLDDFERCFLRRNR